MSAQPVEPTPIGLGTLIDLHERHLLAVSILGHRCRDDGSLSAEDVADLATLLSGAVK